MENTTQTELIEFMVKANMLKNAILEFTSYSCYRSDHITIDSDDLLRAIKLIDKPLYDLMVEKVEKERAQEKGNNNE